MLLAYFKSNPELMNQNGGPERLIAQMKSLNGNTDGFQIVSSIKSSTLKLLTEFMPFKEFVTRESAALGLKKSGEFYFNFTKSGFTGIVCFSGSHFSLQTDPLTSLVQVEIFLSDRLLNNINISESLYRRSISFFEAAVVMEEHIYR